MSSNAERQNGTQGRELGECLIEVNRLDPLGSEVITVKRADPRVRINADLLQEISILTVRDEPRGASLVDDVLTIHGANQTVVYRVDYADWDAETDSYAAEWPD